MNDQIKEMLDRLSDLDESGLATLEGDILSAFTELEKSDPTPASVEGMTALADALDSVRGELTRRSEQAAELKAKAEEASARVKGETELNAKEDEDEESEAAEVDVEVDDAAGEPIAEEIIDIPTPEAEAEPEVEVEDEVVEEEDEEEKKKALPFSDESNADAPTNELSEASAESEVTEAAEEAESEVESAEDEVEEAESEFAEERTADAPETPATEELATEAVEDSELSTTEETPKEENAMTASSEAPQGAINVPADAAPVLRVSDRPALDLAIVAGADIPGYGAGQPLENMNQVADAFAKRLHTLSNVMGQGGQRYNIASLTFAYDESRRLGSDDMHNVNLINDVVSPEAITAAAGICAPLETRYEVNVCGDTDRPIRDALARFSADRGGVRIWGAPALPFNPSGTAAGFGTGAGVGIWSPTGANAGAAKGCSDAKCSTPTEIMLDAIYNCMCFSNFTNRFFPEVVKANTDLSLIAHARQAELNLLQKIYDASTKATAANPATKDKIGVTRNLIRTITAAAAAMRRKNRLATNSPIRVILPSWVLDAMDADLALQAPGDGLESLMVAQSRIESLLSSRGINVTWSLDAWAQTGGKIAEAPLTKAEYGFETSVEFPMFPEGTFLFLDGGTLDLGVTRDKSSLASNEYCTFVETFESAAMVGCESLWVKADVCITGAAGQGVAVACA